jgi:DNA-directed RNA polymerase I and III subunit RPAC1
VYIEMNSSIIHDEVLAHRLGLVPIAIDPRRFEFRGDGDANSANTLVFSLDVTYERAAGQADTTLLPGGGSAPVTMPVYASHLEWCPQGDQEATFGVGGVRPAYEDILLAKLRPGQSIKLEAHCCKGIGKDHAKFSPVATASYRLMPTIELKAPLSKSDAQHLVDLCPMNVFDIEDMGGGGSGKKSASSKGSSKANTAGGGGNGVVVARPRDCTVCRECIRQEGWVGKVRLARVPDHFIFKVESVGMLSPRDIVKESFRILKEKCDNFLEILDGSSNGAEGAGAEDEEDDVAAMLS